MPDFYGNPYANPYGNPYQRTFGNNLQYQQQVPQPTPQPVAPSQLRTNKIFVTSLEDALTRYADPNTITVYHNQDEKCIYEIMVDIQGKKSYKTFELSEFSAQISHESKVVGESISLDQIKAMEERISALEKELSARKPKEIKKGGTE